MFVCICVFVTMCVINQRTTAILPCESLSEQLRSKELIKSIARALSAVFRLRLYWYSINKETLI